MIEAGSLFAAVLAAGLSRRFEGGNKLTAMLGKRSVLDHALDALRPFAFQRRAIVARPGMNADGFAIIANDRPDLGMTHSLSLAAQAAQASGADYLLVTLGDMPMVTDAAIARLLDACPPEPDALAASVPVGGKAGPPAIFGRDWIMRLANRSGGTGVDAGARGLLRDPANRVVSVALPAGQGVDIDTREALAELSSRMR